jgi:hypothetical protein
MAASSSIMHTMLYVEEDIQTPAAAALISRLFIHESTNLLHITALAQLLQRPSTIH